MCRCAVNEHGNTEIPMTAQLDLASECMIWVWVIWFRHNFPPRHEATTAAALPVWDAPGSSFPVLDVPLPHCLRVLPSHCRRCPSIEKMHSHRWSQRRPPAGALHQAVGDCLPREGVEFGPAHHLQLVSGVRTWQPGTGHEGDQVRYPPWPTLSHVIPAYVAID